MVILKRVTILLLLLAALPVWAGLTARIDRAQLRVGESFQLLIEKSGRYSGAGPDLTPLEREFDLLGNSRSSRINIVNGEMDASTQWTVTLSPKRAGTLTVPAIDLEGERTPSFPIQVSAASASASPGKQEAAQGGGELFMEVESSPASPYLQAQLTYRVKIYRTVDFNDASLSDPDVEGATIERIGDDVSYTATRDGRRYQVIERRYAIFPARSGPLRIVGPVLNAEIPTRDGGGWRDPFQGIFARTRPVQIKAQDRTVEVRPAQGSGPWLPAEALTLTEQWSPEVPAWRVGEPVTRTLTLEARGLTGAHLPPIQVDVAGAVVNAYPDQPSIETDRDGDRLVGRRVERIALVPGKPGRFTLPEIRVRWWDTQADQAREAVLPARTIEVAGAVGEASPAPPEGRPVPAPAVRPPASPVTVAEAPFWRWLALLFGGLWLITSVLWWRGGRSREGRAEEARGANPQPRTGEREAINDFKRACDAGDPAAARNALLAWGAVRWPDRPPFSLGALAARFDDEGVAEAVRTLDRRLYHPDVGGEEGGKWDGAGCRERLVPALERRGHPARKGSPLPNLY